VFCIFQHISLDLLFLGNAEAYIGWGGKLNGHFPSHPSYVRNIRAINDQNLLICFQVTVKKSRGCFLRHSVMCNL